MGIYDQADFDIRLGWGEEAVKRLSPISDATVIVDVLSFSTSVDLATSQGVLVYPCVWRDAELGVFAESVGAEIADARNPRGHSLSPSTLESLPPAYRMVLPSLNGSHLTMCAKAHSTVIAGCLRNATAVSRKAAGVGTTIAIIACGERWKESLTLRPALEDLIGAGAIVSGLRGARSPEANAAVAAFESASSDLEKVLRQCASGREKLAHDKARDVELAAQYDVSRNAPTLTDNALRI